MLQDGEFERVGGREVRRVAARFIAATNVSLADRVRAGRFREDLYFRLNVFRIRLPPLRERRTDVPLLVAHFVARSNARLGRDVLGASGAALARLEAHPWPGNVRELENAVEHAVLRARGPLVEPDDLPPEIGRGPAAPASALDFRAARRAAAAAFEREFARRALAESGGRVSEAARRAGLRRQSFQRLMARHGLRSEDYRAPGSVAEEETGES